jgi:hypothetical protein
MTIAKRKSTTDDKIEAKRKIIRQSLDQITTELETELRHAASIYKSNWRAIVLDRGRHIVSGRHTGFPITNDCYLSFQSRGQIAPNTWAPSGCRECAASASRSANSPRSAVRISSGGGAAFVCGTLFQGLPSETYNKPDASVISIMS